MIEKKCSLEECEIDISETFRTKYCSDEHSNLDRQRRLRLKKQINTPYLVTVERCPIDGRLFPVEVFRKPGRPKKYDCQECSNIAEKIRAAMK